MGGLIRFELKKLLAEKKSLIGLLNIVIINILFSLAFYLRDRSHGGKAHEMAPEYQVSAFVNAYSYVQSILAPSVFLLFPMVLAVMGAHILAGEIEVGSIRMMMIRPVKRWQVLGSKFVALCVYSVAMLLLLGLSSYLAAVLQFKPTGVVLVPGAMYALRDTYVLSEAVAPWRILLSYSLALPMLMSVAAMALMFSLIMRHFIAASILTSTVYFASYIVGGIPFLSGIHPYLPTRYWPFWKFALMTDIPWPLIGEYALWTAGYTGVFLALGALLFALRDI